MTSGKYCENFGQAAQCYVDIVCQNNGVCIPGATLSLPATCGCSGTLFTGSLCQAETITCFQTPVRIMPSALKLESTLSHARAVARGTLAIIAKLPKKVIVVPPATRVLQLPSDVASDTASCKCDSRYIGETCDIDLVFLIALPLAIGSCCWVLFLLELPVSPGR